MTHSRTHLLFIAALSLTAAACLDATDASASLGTSAGNAADAFSGVSGPGEPVQGAGLGGWRSSKEGIRYKGEHPKANWQLDWDARQTSSDQVIELGLLPPIKPLWELHLRDTIINIGGDGLYYMTGSSGDNIWDRTDGIELWRSADLKKWDYLGLVWSLAKEATWQKGAHFVWAPEIHYLKKKNTYVMTLCVSGGTASGTGFLVSSTGKPEGPYLNPFRPDARITGGIDSTIFEDDDGKLYYTWGHADTIYQLKDDLSGFVDGPHHIALDPASEEKAQALGVRSGVGSEGPSIFKRNGRYYLGAAHFIGGVDRKTGRNGRYSSCVAMADNIYGPYTNWAEAVPCGAGGNYFQDKTGDWYCTYFGNDEASPFREKPGLVRIDFEPDGRIKIADEQPAFILRDGAPAHWRKAPPVTTPAAADVKNPPPPIQPPALPGTGISGPDAIHPQSGKKMNDGVTSSVVTSGLLPDLKPLIPDTQLRDTVVILGGDGNYYLTGSSGADIWDHNDGGELWRSLDLKTWNYLGLVWTFDRDATWEREWRWHHKPVRALWAPELHYIRRLNNYFITFNMPPGDRGILKSTSGKPEGPYVNALANDAKLPGDIDASLFEDDDGAVYLVYGGGWVARMQEDLSGLAEEPRKPELLHPDTDSKHHAETCLAKRNCADLGHEGAFMFRRNGKYYLTAADTYEGRYSSMVAVSDRIYGPYDQRHEAVPTGGGTDYFQDKEGNWWCGYFGNDDLAPFREKPALVKVEFGADGHIRVADEQPAFVLHEGAPTHGKKPTGAGPTARVQ